VKFIQLFHLALVLFLFVFNSGCARSSAFKKDQTHYKEFPHSYYGSLGQGKSELGQAQMSPTQQIEAFVQPKKRVVVFDFWNNTPVQSEEVGSHASDELKRALHLSRKVIVSEKTETARKTEDFLRGEDIRVDQLVREGRRIGASAAVLGRINRLTFRQRGDDVGILSRRQSFAVAEVELKLFDMMTGRELLAVRRSGQASSSSLLVVHSDEATGQRNRVELAKLALRDAVLQFVPPLISGIDKMLWQGNVAKVAGDKVFINAGRASGLVFGDILIVSSPGEEIYDPQTGAFLGKSRGMQKGTLEVREFVGEDGAMGMIHSGGQFLEGDIVKLY